MFHGGLTDRHKKMEVKRMSIFDHAQFCKRENEIRDYMSEVGVTVKDLAGELHVSRSTVMRMFQQVDNVNDLIQIVDRIAEREAA